MKDILVMIDITSLERIASQKISIMTKRFFASNFAENDGIFALRFFFSYDEVIEVGKQKVG